jgi:hypothetical protein
LSKERGAGKVGDSPAAWTGAALRVSLLWQIVNSARSFTDYATLFWLCLTIK